MNKSALVWGASGGIGAAMVARLKAEGWQVYAAARHDEHISAKADIALHFEAEQASSVEQVVQRVAQETEGIDLMVYAVGSIAYGKLDELSVDGWQTTFASNVFGAYSAAMASLTLMPEGAEQVFIGAYLDHLRILKMGAYVAAKAALTELVLALRREHRRHRFTLVRPGAVDTGFWRHVALKLPTNAKHPDQVAEAIWQHHHTGTLGDLDL